MFKLSHQEILELLQNIVEFELAGAIRYTHYSLLVIDCQKSPIIDFLREQATESLEHAQRAGKFFISLGGIPKPRIASLEQPTDYSIQEILAASIAHENRAIAMYKSLFDGIDETDATYQEIRQFAQNMLTEESSHHQEMQAVLAEYKILDADL
ncbi:ferritin-like domain-containing protein [Calothrix sp. NIES-3974]|uniref:ferritin-like domain-containing protein n=1 Tax=Calothrix sp. NIES-3974 TaxID=2005462 RepID=UPI000B622C9C|nr:ferritin-like domain-containing protein [Calothrix sp. NIES-3974]BAZ04679.1 hypothetical protein NIES3974_13220 [Calothrix sp. NIES-3974]